MYNVVNTHFDFMKKIILTLALVAAAATSAFAQFGIGAGYANNNQKVGENSSATNGFFVEGTYSIPVAGEFSIVPGVRYTYLGETTSAATNIAGINIGGSSTLVEHYLAIPVMAQYGIDLGAAKILAFAGPTFNLGLASQTKVEASVAGISADKPINNYGDNSIYSRTNVFVGGGLGIEISSFQIKAAYDFGLLNRYNSDNVTCKDNQFRVGVAYLF